MDVTGISLNERVLSRIFAIVCRQQRFLLAPNHVTLTHIQAPWNLAAVYKTFRRITYALPSLWTRVEFSAKHAPQVTHADTA